MSTFYLLKIGLGQLFMFLLVKAHSPLWTLPARLWNTPKDKSRLSSPKSPSWLLHCLWNKTQIQRQPSGLCRLAPHCVPSITFTPVNFQAALMSPRGGNPPFSFCVQFPIRFPVSLSLGLPPLTRMSLHLFFSRGGGRGILVSPARSKLCLLC